jgi:hypothetical protein
VQQQREALAPALEEMTERDEDADDDVERALLQLSQQSRVDTGDEVEEIEVRAGVLCRLGVHATAFHCTSLSHVKQDLYKVSHCFSRNICLKSNTSAPFNTTTIPSNV